MGLWRSRFRCEKNGKVSIAFFTIRISENRNVGTYYILKIIIVIIGYSMLDN